MRRAGCAVLSLTFVFACGDARSTALRDAGADAATRPDDDAAASGADADDAATTPDADAGAPTRLRYRPLLGRTAIDNRLYDLALDPTSRHWLVSGGDGSGTFTRLVREAHPRAPSDGPVLRVRAEPLVTSVLATDALAASGRPLEVAVWVGRRVDVGGQLAVVSVLGTDPSGRAIAADLDPDPELLVADGIEWARFSGRWAASAIGEVTLSVIDGEEGLDLFVTGPSITPVPLEHPRGRPPPAARARPPTARDRAVQATLRQARLGPPAPPKAFPQPPPWSNVTARRR